MPKRTRTPAQEQAEALRALHLHQLGMTEADIAKRMTEEGQTANPLYSISQPTVHRRIQHALSLYVVPAVEDAQRVEIARLDAYLEALSPKLITGDVAAIKAAVSIQERRAKLMGLDKPAEAKPATPTGVHPLAGLIQARRAQLPSTPSSQLSISGDVVDAEVVDR